MHVTKPKKCAPISIVNRPAERPRCRLPAGQRVFVFSDASFASCPLTLRSQSGSAVYFRGVLIAYKTQRQSVVTHSTCASEFVACADTLSFVEALEPQLQLFDGGVGSARPLLNSVFVDNQSAIRIARNDVLSQASKHVKLRHIRVSEEHKRIFFAPTKMQEADAFTKSLGEAIFAMMCV